MGNSLSWAKGSKKPAKVMMIDGTTFKLRTPATAKDAISGHPNHVLMEASDVKLNGVRAKPLDPNQPLKPKTLYFLVELPKLPPRPTAEVMGSRRVRSGINMSAKDRLESLMLSRRAVSDISTMRRVEGEDGGMMVTMRLPKAEVERVMRESGGDAAAVAKRISEICVDQQNQGKEGRAGAGTSGGEKVGTKEEVSGSTSVKREKRMRFAPVATEVIG